MNEKPGLEPGFFCSMSGPLVCTDLIHPLVDRQDGQTRMAG
jgi:hypothetical protein